MNYILDGEIDVGGVKTDARARKYASDNRVSYEEGLRAIVRAQSQQQRQYAAENPGLGMAIQRLGATVAGLPKQSDGSVDIDLALEVINNSEALRELAKEAAGQHLDHLAQHLLGKAHPHEGITYADTLRVVSRDNPAVASMYNGGKATADGLKSILWTIFRYQKQTERTTVRRYSTTGSHISYDANGNEFRTYTLDAVRR